MNEVKKNQPEKKKRFDKWFFIGLGITAAGIAFVSAMIFLYEFYTFRVVVTESNQQVLTSINMVNMLSDVFMIPSVLSMLIYCIMYVSKEGAFDAIAYSTKLVFYSIFARNMRQTKLPATYGDYREMKRAKERSSTLFLLFAAIPFFIVGLIFTIFAASGYYPIADIIVK